MDAVGNQRSIRSVARVAGVGYWSGKDVTVEFRPAPVDSGIVFVRSDRDGIQIPLSVERRIDMPRRTVLALRGERVEMVEHIAAALAGLGVDNCEVHVDEVEMPGLDGSAAAFVEAIEAAGIVEQPAPRRVLRVSKPVRVGNDEAWIEARPSVDDSLTLGYRLDYGEGNAIGQQSFELKMSPEAFRSELASARTFLFQHEAEWLRSKGLGTRVTPRDLLIFGDDGSNDGPIDNTLRFADECVRHKMLDMVGDLALTGCSVVGKITAFRTGHQTNAELARELLQQSRLMPYLQRSA